MNLAAIIIFTLAASLLSVGIAGGLLLLGQKWLRRVTASMIPYALGTLLGAAFLGMLPHALEDLSTGVVLYCVLGGLIIFYFLEKLAVWRHCHEEHCQVHDRAGVMILVGDTLHNFVDGAAIAAAFSGSFSLGVAASVAIIAHEIPQEVGDFAILLESGFSRRRALFYNAASSLAALVGALLTYFLLPLAQLLSAYLLSFSAAGFIYIALADLVPGRRSTGGTRSLLWEVPTMALGMATVALLHSGSAH